MGELALRNPNSILQAKHEEERGRKKAKHQATKAANPAGSIRREQRMRKVEAAEQAATENLTEATDRRKNTRSCERGMHQNAN